MLLPWPETIVFGHSVSVQVKKNISSAGFVDSGPVGWDAVKSSIEVSKVFAILSFLVALASADCCFTPFPGGISPRLLPCELHLACLRDHLTDPIDSAKADMHRDERQTEFPPPVRVPVDGAGG